MKEGVDMSDRIGRLKAKIVQGERISPEEALTLFSWDLIDLGRLGDLRRRMIFPEERVGFIIDRIVNFTNVCEAACRFCAFHARAGRIDPYTLEKDDILKKVGELAAAGGTQVMLQGGLHPEYGLDRYVGLVRMVKDAFPRIYLHSYSPSEIVHMSKKSAVDLDNAVKSLKEAGLDSVPGASDLLVDRVRADVSPRKCSVAEWRTVMESLHRHGMKSSATMTYGMGETLGERIDHLALVRDIQDRTGLFRAFIPWSFSPHLTEMEDIPQATGLDYLRMVAIGRIFLDNVVHIQAGWLTEGMKLAQIALTMGANDMGGVLMEEVVVKATGVETRTNAAGVGRPYRERRKDRSPARFRVPGCQDLWRGSVRAIDLAFSSCPNDTLTFHALLHGCIDTGPFSFNAHIDDVETLNQEAFRSRFQVTKLSFFAYLHLRERYELLDAGAALGFGCGPLLVAQIEGCFSVSGARRRSRHVHHRPSAPEALETRTPHHRSRSVRRDSHRHRVGKIRCRGDHPRREVCLSRLWVRRSRRSRCLVGG